MADFQEDDFLDRLRNLPDIPQGWADEIIALMRRVFSSGATPFGDAALRNVGFSSGNIPPVQGNGLISTTLLPVALFDSPGLALLASNSQGNLADIINPDPRNLTVVTAAQVAAYVAALPLVENVNAVSTQAGDLHALGYFQYFQVRGNRNYTELAELPRINADVPGDRLWTQLPRLNPNAHQPADTVWRRYGDWQQVQLSDPANNYEPIPSPHSGQQYEHGYFATFLRTT